MRNLLCSLAIALVACGPSSKEVASARTAHYKGDKLQLFAATKAVVEGKYQLTKSDETSLGMQTEAKWYSPEGMVVTREGGTGEQTHDMGGGVTSKGQDSMVPDKSVHFMMVVTLLPDGDAWIVKVTPMMEKFHAGSPKAEPLKEGDADVPGWATSKVEELALDIHKALAKYEVKSVPGTVPAGNTPTPPAPDEHSGSAAQGPAAQGSAAPPAKP